MKLRPAAAADGEALAEAQAEAFGHGWSAREITVLMAAPGGYAILAEAEAGRVAGFILCRAIAGEAEILTLAVRPGDRLGGVGRALVEAAMGPARAAGAESCFLEVAAGNAAAIGLYRAAGFAEVGRRLRYYAHADRPAEDALVLRRDLNT
ncbi:MAG TPA: GNAT family N-acetyltransferase [Caulobacteraceae bacterium]|nr:GNAT family N-acetyltransferase [Caulobacteraceae bacterium]